jgi:hypothetical protein
MSTGLLCITSWFMLFFLILLIRQLNTEDFMRKTCNSYGKTWTREHAPDPWLIVLSLLKTVKTLKLCRTWFYHSRNIISYSNESNVFTCDCPEGYYGSSCEHFNPCSRSPCQHDSICTNITTSKYKCLCKPGYTGKNWFKSHLYQGESVNKSQMEVKQL